MTKEPFHPRSPAIVQGQGTINPDANDLFQLRPRNRLDQSRSGTNRRLCKALWLGPTNNTTNCVQPTTGLSHFVHDAKFEKLLCTVKSSTAHHLIGDTLPGSTNEKTHPPHTRKHVEKHLRKTSADVTFGYNDVAGERTLKAPTQCVPFKQGDCGNSTYTVSGVVSKLRSDRRIRIII